MRAAVVERDEQDLGERMLLNFGHTAGHAIEAAGNFERFTHGEGVALGMVVSTRLSELQGLVPQGTLKAVQAQLIAFGLRITASNLHPAELIEFMGSDKKRTGSQLRWILLAEIGRAEIGRAEILSGINTCRVEQALQAILAVE